MESRRVFFVAHVTLQNRHRSPLEVGAITNLLMDFQERQLRDKSFSLKCFPQIGVVTSRLTRLKP